MKEYLKFFVTSILAFCGFVMIGRFVASYRWADLFREPLPLLFFLTIWITLTHLIYPFKTVRRNRRFTIISLIISLSLLVLLLLFWTAGQFMR